MTQTRSSMRRHNNPVVWALVGFCLAVLLPVISPKLASIEGRVLPVTTPLAIMTQEPVDDGVLITVAFTKLRQCDFEGLVWYSGPQRLVVDFEPTARLSPATRIVGPQVSGPWLVRGVQSLEDTEAFVYHRCNGWWTTVTRLFP